MKKLKLITSVFLAIVLLFGCTVSFAAPDNNQIKAANVPTIRVVGTTAYCSSKVYFSGQYINATLELWQGNTRVASWSNSGTSSVVVSGSATIVCGRTYTLKVIGTANGNPFAPKWNIVNRVDTKKCKNLFMAA